MKAEQALVLSNAKLLGLGRPSRKSGVYALFYRGAMTYVGQATGKNGLLNRHTNYLSGSNTHTTHRVFLLDFPDKPARRIHIEDHVSMAWHEVEPMNLAKAIERILIWKFEPPWNRD